MSEPLKRRPGPFTTSSPSPPKRRPGPFTTSSPSPPKSRPSFTTSSPSQPKRRSGPFTTSSPSPPKSRPSTQSTFQPTQSTFQPTQSTFQPPQSIVEGRDLSLLPKQRQGPPPDLSLQQPIQPPQSIVEDRDLSLLPKQRQGPPPYLSLQQPVQPRINLEKTIFILAACHGCLSTTDVKKKSKGHPGFKPDLVTCNIRNLQKKTIAKPGQSVFFIHQHPRNTPNSKSLLDSTGRPFHERYSPRELPTEADDIKRYVDTLTQAEKKELYRKSVDKTKNSINPFNPQRLLNDTIVDYESNMGNLSTTYPTKPDIIQQFNRGIYLSTLIEPSGYPKELRDKDYINTLVYCDIHQDKEQYWECYYHRHDSNASGLIIGFIMHIHMLYYDLYDLNDHTKLIDDLQHHATRDELKELRDVFKKMKNRRSANETKNANGRNVDNNKLIWITTSDIFNIVEIVQDILHKDNVVFIDYACKPIENVEEIEAEKTMEKLENSGEINWRKMGHGGYHKNKSKSRKYKSRKYKSRKYKSKKI